MKVETDIISRIAVGSMIEIMYQYVKTFKTFWMFNSTFSNISAIFMATILVVEEAGVPGENHRLCHDGQATGKFISCGCESRRAECTLFCNLQSRVQTHAVLVIGLYELLGNPTT